MNIPDWHIDPDNRVWFQGKLYAKNLFAILDQYKRQQDALDLDAESHTWDCITRRVSDAECDCVR